MSPRPPFKSVFVALLAALMAGCATIELSKTPAIPVLKAHPAPKGVAHTSPPSLRSASSAAVVPVAPKPTKPLNLTVEGAIAMALEHNHDLLVEEVSPAIEQTYVSEARSAFDPTLVGNYTRTVDHLVHNLRVSTPTDIPSINGGNLSVKLPVQTVANTRTDTASAGITEHLPTGADVSLTAQQSRSTVRNSTTNLNLAQGVNADTTAPTVSLSITQSLLRGAGLRVNLVSLRQAKLDRLTSQYQLRGVAENLVSQVEQTYWDYVLATRQIGIYSDALKVAQTQLDEVNAEITVGRLPESERASAEAEVASRRSSLIDARSNRDTERLALLRLLNPSSHALRTTKINALSDPIIPKFSLRDVNDAVKLALRMRPDLNQARLLVQRDNLQVISTKNGLLPQLNLFVTLSKNLTRTHYVQAVLVANEDRESNDYQAQFGAQFSYPIGNRGARARDQRAELTREKDYRALDNMAQLVEQDVRSAYVEAERTYAQIAATKATRVFQQETLNVEIEKFKLGRSNSLLVAQAQRDLLTAQISEVQAKTAYLNALVNLYQLEGSLLVRRGIQCPGRAPVELADTRVPRLAPHVNFTR